MSMLGGFGADWQNPKSTDPGGGAKWGAAGFCPRPGAVQHLYLGERTEGMLIQFADDPKQGEAANTSEDRIGIQ